MPEVDQVVGIDSHTTRLAEMTAAFPALRAFTSAAEALPHFDAAVLAIPPEAHFAVARDLIRAGKHILVEKPLTLDAEHARSLIGLAAEYGVTLMVGHTFVYNAAVQKLRDLVRSGELGEIYYVDSKRVNLGLYQTHANVIWDLAPHDISIINELMDDVPQQVTAVGKKHALSTMVDNAYIHLEYPRAQASIHVSWLNPRKIREITVVGSRKMAIYDDLADEQRIQIYDKGLGPDEVSAAGAPPLTYRYGDIVAPYVHFVEPLLVEDRHFLECARTGSTPQTSGDRGLEVVQVLQACDQSLASNGPVRIESEGLIDVSTTADLDLRDRASSR